MPHIGTPLRCVNETFNSCAPASNGGTTSKVLPFQHWDVIIQVGFATVYVVQLNITIGGVAAPPNQLVNQFGGAPQSISGGFPRAIRDSQGYWGDPSAHPELRGHPCRLLSAADVKSFHFKACLGYPIGFCQNRLACFGQDGKVMLAVALHCEAPSSSAAVTIALSSFSFLFM